MRKVLFDTNVLVDVLIRRAPFFIESALAWDLASTKLIEAVVAAVTMTNIHYIVEKRLVE